MVNLKRLMGNLFQGYAQETFFDEMFESSGRCAVALSMVVRSLRPHVERGIPEKARSADNAFLTQGVTFTVYNDQEGTERIFPFDLIPRIIPRAEWEHVERGLSQRITALNLFLHDIYHEQKIVHDGVIPAEIVHSAVHFRPEFMGFDVPKDIYIHICGTDLIRDPDGNYLVLEDNARCPSGVSYLLENRQAMKRVFPNLFSRYLVRPVETYCFELLDVLRFIAPDGEPGTECGVAHAWDLQLRLLRAFFSGSDHGDRDCGRCGPGGSGRSRLHENDPRPQAGRRYLSQDRR